MENHYELGLVRGGPQMLEDRYTAALAIRSVDGVALVHKVIEYRRRLERMVALAFLAPKKLSGGLRLGSH
jgi:hypothetical protein